MGFRRSKSNGYGILSEWLVLEPTTVSANLVPYLSTPVNHFGDGSCFRGISGFPNRIDNSEIGLQSVERSNGILGG